MLVPARGPAGDGDWLAAIRTGWQVLRSIQDNVYTCVIGCAGSRLVLHLLSGDVVEGMAWSATRIGVLWTSMWCCLGGDRRGDGFVHAC